MCSSVQETPDQRKGRGVAEAGYGLPLGSRLVGTPRIGFTGSATVSACSTTST